MVEFLIMHFLSSKLNLCQSSGRQKKHTNCLLWMLPTCRNNTYIFCLDTPDCRYNGRARLCDVQPIGNCNGSGSAVDCRWKPLAFRWWNQSTASRSVTRFYFSLRQRCNLQRVVTRYKLYIIQVGNFQLLCTVIMTMRGGFGRFKKDFRVTVEIPALSVGLEQALPCFFYEGWLGLKWFGLIDLVKYFLRVTTTYPSLSTIWQN